MEQIRKPFQGVGNIILFNRHFFIFALVFLIGLCVLNYFTQGEYRLFLFILFVLTLSSTLISLCVSFYVYDVSDLYKLNWLKDIDIPIKIININAGFDETSSLLKDKFKNAELIVLDFYDSEKHTEVSIKRARSTYPLFPNTLSVQTACLPQPDNFADKIFVFLAAHEIRDEKERTIFFKELRRVLKPAGEIFVVEHLRDAANFCVYNIGFFHFLSKSSWLKVFRSTDLSVFNELKITPFITTFTLRKHDIAS